MTSALDNAIATATMVATLLENGAPATPSAIKALPTLIAHLRNLDPSGARTAELIARLEKLA